MSDGVRLAVDVIGEGDPVTAVGHGLTGSRNDLAVLAPFIPGTKVLFDFRGHGASDRPPPGRYSMDHFAADVDHVAAAFGAAAVVGVSLGGGAVLRLLRSNPDRFEKLVFILPARLERSAAAHRKLQRLADLLETKPLDEVADLIVAEEAVDGMFDEFPAARQRRREAILAMNGDGMPHAIRESLEDPPLPDLEPLCRVAAPALVVAQEGDPVHRADVARDLADVFPRVELLIFPDRHALLRDVVPLTEKVATFLGQGK